MGLRGSTQLLVFHNVPTNSGGFFFFFKEKIILFLNLLILIKCSVLKNNEDVSYDLNLQPIESEIKGL